MNHRLSPIEKLTGLRRTPTYQTLWIFIVVELDGATQLWERKLNILFFFYNPALVIQVSDLRRSHIVNYADSSLHPFLWLKETACGGYSESLYQDSVLKALPCEDLQTVNMHFYGRGSLSAPLDNVKAAFSCFARPLCLNLIQLSTVIKHYGEA